MQPSLFIDKRRIAALLAALVVAVGLLTQTFRPQAAEAAYHQVYIQTTVDVDNWEVVAAVINESMSFTATPLEYQRIGKETLDLLCSKDLPSDVASYVDRSPANDGLDSTEYLVLSFPGDTKANTIFQHVTSTNVDMARATLIRNSLIYDMNNAFHFIYGDYYVPSGNTTEEKFSSYKSTMKAFLEAVPSGTISASFEGQSYTSTISQCSSSAVHGLTKRDFPDSTVDFSDYICISRSNNSTGETEERTYLYRMPKGYRGISSRDLSAAGVASLSSAKDALFVHWGYFGVEAVINYQCDDKVQVTIDNVYESTPSAFENVVSTLLGSIADGIMGMLGLWSFDEMLYNSGNRGTSSYVCGIFPTTWQPYIWAFFYVMEIAALCMLIFAIVVNIGKKAMSTINPIARANAIEQVKYLFIVAIALGLLPMALQVLLNVTANLTGIFSDALGVKTCTDRFKNLASSSGLMAVLTYLVYLGALIYFNIFYVVRAFTIAFLIMFAPLFIVNLALGESRRQMSMIWAKELAANLFIQPIQAMAMCFILMVPSSGRRIESLIIAYILIPITNMLRALFFGQAGGLVDQISNRGEAAAVRTGKTAASIAHGAVAGGYNAYQASKGGSAGDDTSQKSDSSEAGSDSMDNQKPRQAPLKPPAGTETKTDTASTDAPIDADFTASRVASSSGTETETPSAGKNVPPNDMSNAVRQGMSGGEWNAESKELDGDPFEQPPGKAFPLGEPSHMKIASAAAGAVAMGVLGGAADTFNRRVFGANPGSQGGVFTQLSRKSASKAADMNNERLSAAKAVTQHPLERGFDISAYEAAMGNTAENPYEMGFAERKSFTADDGASADTYTIRGTDTMKAAGISSVTDGPVKGTSEISFDAETLNVQDQERMTAMLELWNQNGFEREAMEEAGILDVSPIQKRVGGKSVTTGASITVDNAKFQENFGVSAQRSQYAMDTASGSAPAIVPDVGAYLSSSEASSLYAESQAFQQVSAAAADAGITMDVSEDYVTLTAPTPMEFSGFGDAVGSAFNNYELTEFRADEQDAVPMTQVKIPRTEFTQSFYHGEPPPLPRTFVGEQISKASPVQYEPPPIRKTYTSKQGSSQSTVEAAMDKRQRKDHHGKADG